MGASIGDFRLRDPLGLFSRALTAVVFPADFLEEPAVAAFEHELPATVEHDQTIGQRVQKHFVVGHQDDGAIEGIYGGHQRVTRFHVEMVGRLIQKQQVRRRNQKFSQENAALLAAGED